MATKTAAQKRAEADARAAAKDEAGPAAENGNGNGNGRTQLVIPNAGRGEKINHATLYSAEALAAYDTADATRADRADAILADGKYDGTLTGSLFRKLLPLLREPINPRYVVTTGPAEKGKPMVTTGIQSVQVQIERLNEVLGGMHWRTLAYHTADGTRCHVFVVIGNNLQWCSLVGDGDKTTLRPFTLVDGDLVGENADIVAQHDGWGGHARGTAPGDIWKGSYTNAAKLALARVGPGGHVYLLDFEDDPHVPEAKGVNRGQGRGDRQGTQPREAAAPATDAQPEDGGTVDHDAKIAEFLAIEDDLHDLRAQAVTGLQAIASPPARIHASLREYKTKRQLEDLVHRVSLALDEEEAKAEQSTLDVGGDA